VKQYGIPKNDMFKNVLRETMSMLEKFVQRLSFWQEKVNLISRGNPGEVWDRHVLDSLQLMSCVPENTKVLTDLGSGAGFPGLILSIVSDGRFQVKLVESRNKKCMFLQEVIRELNLNAEVNCARIEKITPWRTDVITSRALARLPKLLSYSCRFIGPETKLIFHKGKSVDEEILEAQKEFSFEVEKIKSCTSEEGWILVITNAKRKMFSK
jgi:16S rRNA (guanine527-N7)-methyltransferase